MKPTNYNAVNSWTYTVKQTVDLTEIFLLVNPDPYREVRELIERIKQL